MAEAARTAVVRAGECAERVSAIFDGLFGLLHQWRSVLEAELDASAPWPPRLDPLVAEMVRPALTVGDPLVVGAGFIGSSREDRTTELIWWLGPLTANPLFGTTETPAKLDLSTRGYVDYLRDFRSLEWYSVPEATKRTHITGPYVDHLCTCDYILTLTMPVQVGGAVVGVVGADVPVKRVESELLPLFLRAGSAMTLLGESDRVIVSTDPRLECGAIVRGGQHERLLCPGTPFSLAVGSAEDRNAPRL